MGSPRIEAAMDVPGRLAYGCTDLTAAWPHGGTGLGFVDRVRVQWDAPVYPVTAMEYGGEVVEEIALAERVMIMAVLRDDDPDALSQAPLNSTAGSPSAYRRVEIGGTNAAGFLYEGRATVVVFTPESVIAGEDDQHDLVVFFNAIPRMEESQTINQMAREERQYGLAFRALRDSNGVLAHIGRRSDLSLS